MKKLFLLKSIQPDWSITLIGLFLFTWGWYLDIKSLIDAIHGVYPYPDWQTNLQFFAVCIMYTIALCFTLICRVFSLSVWLLYFLSFSWVIYHMPMDLTVTDTPHWYAFLDALYIIHGGYFVRMGFDKVVSCIDFGFLLVKTWIKSLG
jgi:hypothetical protein